MVTKNATETGPTIQRTTSNAQWIDEVVWCIHCNIQEELDRCSVICQLYISLTAVFKNTVYGSEQEPTLWIRLQRKMNLLFNEPSNAQWINETVWCIGCNIQQVHIPSLSFHLQVHSDLYTRWINSKRLQLFTFLLTTAMLILRWYTHSIFAPPPSRFNTTAYAACILQMLPNQLIVMCYNQLLTTKSLYSNPARYNHNPKQDSLGKQKLVLFPSGTVWIVCHRSHPTKKGVEPVMYPENPPPARRHKMVVMCQIHGIGGRSSVCSVQVPKGPKEGSEGKVGRPGNQREACRTRGSGETSTWVGYNDCCFTVRFQNNILYWTGLQPTNVTWCRVYSDWWQDWGGDWWQDWWQGWCQGQ